MKKHRLDNLPTGVGQYPIADGSSLARSQDGSLIAAFAKHDRRLDRKKRKRCFAPIGSTRSALRLREFERISRSAWNTISQDSRLLASSRFEAAAFMLALEAPPPSGAHAPLSDSGT
jgi:hypothetical protein